MSDSEEKMMDSNSTFRKPPLLEFSKEKFLKSKEPNTVKESKPLNSAFKY